MTYCVTWTNSLLFSGLQAPGLNGKRLVLITLKSAVFWLNNSGLRQSHMTWHQVLKPSG